MYRATSRKLRLAGNCLRYTSMRYDKQWNVKKEIPRGSGILGTGMVSPIGRIQLCDVT